MLRMESLVGLQGQTLRAFVIRRRDGKKVAFGAVSVPGSDGFVLMYHERYQNNSAMLARIRSMTGLLPRLYEYDGRKGCSRGRLIRESVQSE